jgi:predicted XRE-type DNA-binding protein
MRKGNKHRGSDFDDFLRGEAIFDDVQATALKRALAEAVNDAMKEANLSKVEVARRMGTSRSQLDRVLDPTYTAVQLDTLIKAASAVGRALGVSLKRVARSRPRGRQSGQTGGR